MLKGAKVYDEEHGPLECIGHLEDEPVFRKLNGSNFPFVQFTDWKERFEKEEE